MKQIFGVLFISVLVLCSGCQDDNPLGGKGNETNYPADRDREFDNGSGIVFPDLNEQLIADLELLGKIWGFLKYHHPKVGQGHYNWDYELFRILPKYVQVKDREARDKVITDWINQYGDIPVCTTCRETPASAYIKPDLLWAENSNMNDWLKTKIREIYQKRHQGTHYYIEMDPTISNPIFLNEKPYSGMAYPDAGFRLLALYRYWSMIQYFFPCKYQTDKKWDDILPEYIPLFISAEDRLAYESASIQIIGEINDTHAAITAGFWNLEASKGNKYAALRVWFIEGKLVVTEYYNPEFKRASGLEIGDIITHINGESVESIVEKQKKYYPASNEPSRLRDMSFDLLRSNQNSISIDYISSDKAGRTELPLYERNRLNKYGTYKVNRDEKCYKLIDENTGYVTLASILQEDISAFIASFKNTKGIIIDIRNYPSSFVPYLLGGYFVLRPTPFSKFTIGNIDNPGEFVFNKLNIITDLEITYQGKLVIIVNEITQSQAEFTAMAFRACMNTIIIGSTTAGADGNVSAVILPGGLQSHISGLGTYYPDGTQTQRVGIVPDIWIEPTIQGIREGRDELLEMAIQIINKE